jgi:hypothetical protein
MGIRGSFFQFFKIPSLFEAQRKNFLSVPPRPSLEDPRHPKRWDWNAAYLKPDTRHLTPALPAADTYSEP